jgi:hypothetical protein
MMNTREVELFRNPTSNFFEGIYQPIKKKC